jgi:hypothetical protein
MTFITGGIILVIGIKVGRYLQEGEILRTETVRKVGGYNGELRSYKAKQK